ncbi:unnamed protein product, partial [Amoebophrya sp. A25]
SPGGKNLVCERGGHVSNALNSPRGLGGVASGVSGASSSSSRANPGVVLLPEHDQLQQQETFNDVVDHLVQNPSTGDSPPLSPLTASPPPTDTKVGNMLFVPKMRLHHPPPELDLYYENDYYEDEDDGLAGDRESEHHESLSSSRVGAATSGNGRSGPLRHGVGNGGSSDHGAKTFTISTPAPTARGERKTPRESLLSGSGVSSTSSRVEYFDMGAPASRSGTGRDRFLSRTASSSSKGSNASSRLHGTGAQNPFYQAFGAKAADDYRLQRLPKATGATTSLLPHTSQNVGGFDFEDVHHLLDSTSTPSLGGGAAYPAQYNFDVGTSEELLGTTPLRQPQPAHDAWFGWRIATQDSRIFFYREP